MKSNSIWHGLVQYMKNCLCCFSARAHVKIEEAIETAVDVTIKKTTETAVQEADIIIEDEDVKIKALEELNGLQP